MAKPYEVSLVSNTRPFVAGMSDAGDAVDGITDSLDDLVKAAKKNGDRAGDQLADGIEDGAKDARSDVERLEESFEQLAKAAKRSSTSAGDDIRDKVKGGADDGKRAVGEMGDEVVQEAREMGASFGSVEDALDSVQSVISNMFAGFGPQGVAAGVVIAATIGLLAADAQKAAEAINANKTAMGELANEIVEAGGDIDAVDLGAKIREWGIEIADSKEFWELWQKDAVSNVEKAAKAAVDAGGDFDSFFRGLSGYDAKAAEKALETTRAKAEELQEQVNNQPLSWDSFFGATEADQQLSALQNVGRELENVKDKAGDAEEAARVMAESTAADTAAAEANAVAQDARAEAISSLQSPIDDAIGAYDDFKNAETGALDPAAYLQGIADRVAATTNFNANVASISTQFGLSAAESQAILDNGVDFAPMLQSIIDSGLAPKFVEQIQSGVGGGQAILDNTKLSTDLNVNTSPATTSVGDWFKANASKPAAEVKVTTDTKAAETAIKRVTDAKYEAKINTVTDTQDAANRLGLLALPRTARVVVDLDLSAANREMAAFVNKSRTAVVTGKVVLP